MNISSCKLWFVVVLVYRRYVDKCEDVWQSGADLLASKGIVGGRRIKKSQIRSWWYRRHCCRKAPNLDWEADGEYYQGQNEAEFVGGRDSPDNLHVIPHLAPLQVLETQDNSEEPEGERNNRMLEEGM